jgi:hypothetical protein
LEIFKQLEIMANYVSSYIPTLGSSVTRLADSASKTGISSLIGQTAGTLFLDFIFKKPELTTAGQIGVATSDNNNRVILWNNSTLNTLALQIKANSISVVNNISLGAFVDGTAYKIAIGYQSGNTAVFVNGTQVVSNTAAFTFSAAITDFFLGKYEAAGIPHQRITSAILYSNRLDNAELASLTTVGNAVVPTFQWGTSTPTKVWGTATSETWG